VPEKQSYESHADYNKRVPKYSKCQLYVICGILLKTHDNNKKMNKKRERMGGFLKRIKI
jgi:hypothetical protein